MKLKSFCKAKETTNDEQTTLRMGENICKRGFPGGTVVENLPANAGDTGLSPGLGKHHMPRSN